MKKKVSVAAVVLLMASLALAGCSSNDPQTVYSQALQKTNAIQLSKDKMSLDISNANSQTAQKSNITIDMTTDRSAKTAAGQMTLSNGTNQVSAKMYTNGDTSYIQQNGQDKYIKVSSKDSQFSDQTAKEYADKILAAVKQNADLQKSVTMTTDSSKNKVITFTLPADKAKSMVEAMLKSSLTSDEVKQAVKDQVTAQAKSSSSTDKKDLSADDISKIVDGQMTDLSKQVDTAFRKITFGDLKYVATINSDGYLSKQDFSITISGGDGKSADSTKVNVGISDTMEKLDASTAKVELPKFTSDNTVEGGSLDNLLLGALGQ